MIKTTAAALAESPRHTNEAAKPPAGQPEGHSSQQNAEPAAPPTNVIGSNAEIEITSIQIVSEVPMVDREGNEDLSTTAILAKGEPSGPFGPEMNVAGAAERLKRGEEAWVRITLTIIGDERVKFTPVDVTQSKIEPVLIGTGEEATIAKGVSTKPITRISEDGRTIIAYIAIESSNSNLSDLPRRIVVKATAFYRDAFSTGQRRGEFSIN